MMDNRTSKNSVNSANSTNSTGKNSTNSGENRPAGKTSSKTSGSAKNSK